MAKYYEIDFLEAGTKGSGDAIALRYETDLGFTYIHVVDGGYSEDGQRLVDHIEKYYDNAGFINHVVLTHPDGDHAAGLKTVLEKFEVGVLWMNRPWNHINELLPLFEYKYTKAGLIQRLKKNFPFTAELEQIAIENGIEIRDGFQGSYLGEFRILAPTKERYIDLVVASDKTPEPVKPEDERRLLEEALAALKNFIFGWGEENLKGDTEGTSAENETSIVQYAELCGEKILLTGDAGVGTLEQAYDYAISTGISLPGLNRFQVPHHGSRRNVSSDILDKWLGSTLDAQLSGGDFTAVISANRSDKSHPKKAVVRAMIHRGANVFQPTGALHVFKNADSRGWSDATSMPYPDEMEE